MSPFEIFFIIVFIVNICLGLGVFLTNKKRTLNQHYLTASILIALWLFTNWLILNEENAINAKFLIRIATAIALTLPVSSHFLRLSILFPADNWQNIFLRAKYVLLVCLGSGLICFSPFFIQSVKMPKAGLASLEVPEPVYGWGYFIFAAFFIGLVVSLLILFIGDRKKLVGLQKIELDFITIGYCAALAMATLCGVLVTIFTASSQTVPMANASSILAFTSIISYGIATKRILNIATVAQRFLAYVLLASYLIVLYLCVWHGISLVTKHMETNIFWLPQIAAALAVAFSMAPVHGRLQQISSKLITSSAMNVPAVMKKAGHVFQSMSTLNALLNHFSHLLVDSLGAENIHVLFLTEGKFVQSYPHLPREKRIVMANHNALIEMASKENEPISLDSLIRGRQTPLVQATIDELRRQNANIAVGIFSKSQITGIVLFGARLNGRIYDKTEQDALQILCNQFAVALENAQMYTEMQDSKIRNDILLDQLVSGVIVAGPDRKISMINHEAQRIISLEEGRAMGEDISILPFAIEKALASTLDSQMGTRNVDGMLFSQTEESISIRMGSAYLMGHDDKPMGALLVFTDMTELKGLEKQVRRSDQLSSVGTLAAGMAHEIKNPLVTIKTFTQLLPDRYEDADFRNDFSSLVAHEVSRIDGIVNQLLSFSKPTKPHLFPMHIHDTIAQTLKLMHEQLVQKNIALNSNLNATSDRIMGDESLLFQALINFNLNAIDAIENSGSITVNTSNCAYRFANGDGPSNATLKQCLRFQITDTGKGIDEQSLSKIFDPFFTSKSEGTGMGLSVSHGIIQEHHGVVEVESELGKGTTFYIYIPLIEDAS